MGKRDFLKLSDLSLSETKDLFGLAAQLKVEPKGTRATELAGRSIAIVLEKASTRTRVSFEIGAAQLGAHPVVLATQGSQLARGEPIRDTARVLARYCDAIVFRTYASTRLHEMALAGVPVINALSDDGHPVQVLCDIFTIEEHFEHLHKRRSISDAPPPSAPRHGSHSIAGRRIAFVGDCSSNMARSWLEAAAMFGFHLVLAGPPEYMPPESDLSRVRAVGEHHLTITHDPAEAVADCDVVNTDVWTSMGQEDESETRLQAFAGWTVNEKMLSRAAPNAIVLHCLPAHRGEEIDDATLEGPRSRVWDQAENRLHVQKALLLWLLGQSDPGRHFGEARLRRVG